MGADVNDVSMFERAAFSVAMARAPGAAKAAAQMVAPPGEEGVAWALAQWHIP